MKLHPAEDILAAGRAVHRDRSSTVRSSGTGDLMRVRGLLTAGLHHHGTLLVWLPLLVALLVGRLGLLGELALRAVVLREALGFGHVVVVVIFYCADCVSYREWKG